MVYSSAKKKSIPQMSDAELFDSVYFREQNDRELDELDKFEPPRPTSLKIGYEAEVEYAIWAVKYGRVA
jgi:hypothetical protein